jgi:hypothetical protein
VFQAQCDLLVNVLGIRGTKRGCFAIGAVEQGNGCRYASAWRAVLGDIGKRLDGFRRVLAHKLSAFGTQQT